MNSRKYFTMYFYKILTLGLHLLLCQRVSSSKYSFLENEISSLEKTENILGQFLADFNRAHVMKIRPRHVVIIGASTDELRQVRPLIESHPYIICSSMDSETCLLQEVIESRSYIVIFLKDFDEQTLEKNLRVLSDCGTEHCEQLFIFKGIEFGNNEIMSFLSPTIAAGVPYNRIAHLDRNVVKLYDVSFAKNCRLEITLTLVWRPETDTSKINIPKIMIRQMNGCSVPLGTYQHEPEMIIEKTETGSLAIAGGMDGMLVLSIAQELDFTVDLRHPSLSEVESDSKKLALLKDIASGILAFGVSRWRPTGGSTISISYDEECLTWAVPRTFGSSRNLVWTEFPWTVWVLIGSVFACNCIIGYVDHTVISPRNANWRRVGFTTIIFDVLSINMGHPVMRIPISFGGKLILIAGLYYAVVMTTTYNSSLASMLMTTKSSPMVADSEGIVENKLKIGGSAYNYNILNDQLNDSKIASKLIKEYIFYEDVSVSLHRVSYDQDFALLALRSTLEHEKKMTVKAGKLIRFDILNECVLTYPAVMMFRKGSYLLAPVNRVINRLFESGILRYWERRSYMDDKILERQNSDRFFKLHVNQKVKNLFIFYICCIPVCFLVFFVEILNARFQPKKRQAIVRRNNLIPR